MALDDQYPKPEQEVRVRLVNSRNQYEKVVFNITPDLIETRNVNYKMMDMIHAPGQIAAYQNTSSRNFNISQIRLMSRSVEEATRNHKILWTLRGWTMPYFGRSSLSDVNRNLRDVRERNRELNTKVYEGMDAETRKRFAELEGQELRGAPPAVLLLSAYSSDGYNGAQHIRKVPVVLQNLSIPYPSDSDYIPTDTNVPMPILMTIDMTLMETHSPNEYSNFSLSAFKTGTLGHF